MSSKSSSISVLLIDLPTFPKGPLSLSLYAVAAAFGHQVSVSVADLNHNSLQEILSSHSIPGLVGLKVSAQNHHLACEYTEQIKSVWKDSLVLWGGEYPTLEPEICLQTADSIVSGRFEPIADRLQEDIANGTLKAHYRGSTGDFLGEHPPRLDLIPDLGKAYRFMGLPMESSRGCTYKCTFCMVHQMQPGYALKPVEMLRPELELYKGEFLNLVDYNFGVDPDHVVRLAATIRDSEVLGWMGEMCLESLDNDAVLKALAESRCRMIYCGLEAIEEASLLAVNKARTNQIDNYERIIRKVQSYGIQIAGGVILGLPGSQGAAMVELRRFFERLGIVYAKLTFLTYNPGTKVRESMRRKGDYLSEEAALQDGNHLSYLPHGMEAEQIHRDAEAFIRQFYTLPKILRRVWLQSGTFWNKFEILLFNLCYRDVYFQWLEQDVFHDPNGFDRLLRTPVQKSWLLRNSERMLHWVRKRRFLLSKTEEFSEPDFVPKSLSHKP